MLRVAPVLSRVMPIIVPSIINKPIEAMVFPNPSFRVETMEADGKVAKARKRETRNRAINAFIFNFEVNIMIAIILINANTDLSKILMVEIWLVVFLQ